MGFSKTSLLFFFFLFSSSHATSRTLHTPTATKTTFFSTNQRYEKLIKSLNLYPKDQVNILHGNHSIDFVPGKITEKKVSILSYSDGTSIESLDHRSGFYSLPHSLGSSMFYFFFESRTGDKNAPVVIWLTGGPGCGSELALFYENGPFKIANNLSLVWNDYGWDKASNILFVDNPLGAGFSVANEIFDIPHDEIGVSNDLYEFLQEFFKYHPEYVKNDFYITGESYAGKYIPALASKIQQRNKANPNAQINLKGIAIGNGWTNPRIQSLFYAQYAVDVELIDEDEQNEVETLHQDCANAAFDCDAKGGNYCVLASEKCDKIPNKILSIVGNINVYDMRLQCEGELCYDFSNLEKLLNDKRVKDILGVEDKPFVSCSRDVYDNMQQDLMKNLDVGIPTLLESGIKVLIYAGQFDFICNWLGNYKWVSNLPWSGRDQFLASKNVTFVVDGAESGMLNSYGPLSFLKVYDAGHMVPMDQPKVALQMLENWMQGKLN